MEYHYIKRTPTEKCHPLRQWFPSLLGTDYELNLEGRTHLQPDLMPIPQIESYIEEVAKHSQSTT